MTRRRATLAAVLLLAACGACTPLAPEPAPAGDAVTFSEAERAALLTLSPKPPLPPDPTNRVADDPCAAQLGQYLFFETRLSGNGKVACSTCHLPERAFTNGLRFGAAIGTTARHVPSILTSAYNRWWFWDGRADSAWAQALGPPENTVEHGGSRVQFARVLFDAPELRAAYESLFGPLPPMDDAARFPAEGRPDPWDRFHPHVALWKTMSEADQDAVSRVYANIGKSIAAYERRLASGEAPFDAFVRGLRDGDAAGLAAISPAAQRGAKLFVGKARCTTCHHGPLLSDLEFHDLYLVSAVLPPRDTGRFRGIELVKRDMFNAAGRYSDAPEGPAADKLAYLAQQPENWGQFKTPSLRNVAATPPYMHDGRFDTLADVIHYYRTFEGAIPPSSHAERTLQPLDVTDAEAADLLAFLESLTEAPRPAELLTKPGAPLPPACLTRP